MCVELKLATVQGRSGKLGFLLRARVLVDGGAFNHTHKKINQTHNYSCARMPLIRHTKLLIGAGTSPTHKLVLFVNRCTVFVVVSGFPILIAHRPGTDVFGHSCVTQALI